MQGCKRRDEIRLIQEYQHKDIGVIKRIPDTVIRNDSLPHSFISLFE